MKLTLDNINKDLEDFSHILTCKVDTLEKKINEINDRISTLEKAVLLDNIMK